MRKPYATMVASAILFLFFIQMAGTLVESIYILDLLNTRLDEKVLGLLFFFSPVLLLPFRRKIPGWLVWASFALLALFRGITPYLATSSRLLASGLATAAALLLLPAVLTAAPQGVKPNRSGALLSGGLALGIGLSVLLRTLNFSLDYSLTPAGSWVGWGLAVLLGITLAQYGWGAASPASKRPKGVTSAMFGIILILTLVYFVFSAPGVLARWTAGNYPLVVTAVSLLALGWVVLTTQNPGWSARLSPPGLLVWNLLFALALVGTILAHRVPLPLTPDSPAVVVVPPTWIQQIPLVLTLLFTPVIFLDMQVFSRSLQETPLSPAALAPGLLLGSLALVILVLMVIFTNIWGYIEPVSPFFRNKFWLPFSLVGACLTWLVRRPALKRDSLPEEPRTKSASGWYLLLGGIFLATLVPAWRTDRVLPGDGERTSLVVMTYNIQQANDRDGVKSYDRQLALIQQVNPDILALQESDSPRVSLNNNDYVRYYASKLKYYTYYGPTTVAGTYGTAILSRFPLHNPRTVFTFSDQDEVGTAEAEIEVAGRRFTIYNVHPDGSDTAMLAFARTLLKRSAGDSNVIALGDYNLRENELAYQMIAGVYTNAWMAVYPSGISEDGVDMSGTRRIDHIFISPHLKIRDAVYLLAPESATDHPAHWAEVYWDEE